MLLQPQRNRWWSRQCFWTLYTSRIFVRGAIFAIVFLVVHLVSSWSVLADETDSGYVQDKKRLPAPPVDACKDAAKKAQMSCSTMSLANMSPEQAAMTEIMINQLIQMGSQTMSAGANQAEQCSMQMKMSGLMTAINAAKSATCGYLMSECKTSCDAEIAYYKQENNLTQEREADKTLKTCTGYQMNFTVMMMQTMSFGQNFMQNQACVAMTSSNQLKSDYPTYAAPTPATLSADQGCTGSAAQSTLFCICQSQPSNPLCGGQSALSGSAGGTGSVTGLTGLAAPQPFGSEEDDKISSGEFVDPTNATPGGKGPPKEPPPGGGGGPQALGGGGGGGRGDEGGGRPGKSDVEKNVITGASSSAGGGGSGGGPAAAAGGGRGGDGAGGFFDRFNLKQFLPSRKDYKNKGLGGMSIQAADGVTGPMGPSIWEKVSKQYQLQKPNLIQDK